MIVIKKDFVNENTESFCSKGRILTSGKAYFIQDEYGNIVYGGKKCAESLSNTDLTQIPDLTRSLISNHEGRIGGRCGGTGNKQIDTKKSKAITYLMLRVETLHDFKYLSKSLSNPILQKYYQEYQQNHDLSDDAIIHILNIENKLSLGMHKKLSLKNLSTCHAYGYLMKRILAHLEEQYNQDGIMFINNLLEGLHNYCSLTDRQIYGLSRWQQYLPEDLRDAKLKKFL